MSYIGQFESNKLHFGDYPVEKFIRKLASELKADEDELLLLDDKVPAAIRRKIQRRPELFRKLARMDKRTLDRLEHVIKHKLNRESGIVKLQPISMRRSEQLSEAWVQQQIADDPSILGLGDLVLKDKERIQAGAGRLDLLLQDPESFKRYEVEIQLGATDESHLIRTIEYWDIEKRRYPQYEHAAVIVAEEITSRFLNVIQLFNGHIPLIAIKMTTYKVGDDYALTFVKVLDELSFGLVDEDEVVSEPTDRTFWERRGSKKTLEITDRLLAIVNQIEPGASLNYNKHYIGLKVKGSPMNFVTFMPRKAHVIMTFRLPQTQETDEALADVGIDTLPYDSTWKQYRLRISDQPSEEDSPIICDLAKSSRESYGKSI